MSLMSFAAYMENEDENAADVAPVDVSPVDVNDVVDIDAEVEAEQDKDAANDAITEAIDDSTDVALLASRLLEVQRYHHFVKKNGVDSTFLELANYNDRLSKLLNLRIPSCESFGSHGNPYDSTSRDLVAGMENFIKSIWEWIKNLATRIWNGIKGFINKVINFFHNYEKEVKKLQETVKKFEPGSRPEARIIVKGFGPDDFAEIVANIKESWDLDIFKETELSTEQELYAIYSDKIKLKDVDLSQLTRENILTQITALQNLLKESDTLKKQADEMMNSAREQVDTAKKNAQAPAADNAENKEAAEQAKEQASNLNILMQNQKAFANVLIRILRMGMVVPVTWVKAANQSRVRPLEDPKKNENVKNDTAANKAQSKDGFKNVMNEIFGEDTVKEMGLGKK